MDGLKNRGRGNLGPYCYNYLPTHNTDYYGSPPTYYFAILQV